MPVRSKRSTVPATTGAVTPKPKKPSSRLASKPKKTAMGDCYEAAAKFMLDGMLKSGKGPDASVMEGFIVVHAEVMGQGPLEGTSFGHGFVVDTTTDLVIDQSNGRDLRLPKMFYYAIGQIENIGNYHEYTPEEVLENLRKYKHYGPWDLKTSSGL